MSPLPPDIDRPGSAEEEVRRLLAEARHTEAPPPDVTARLDRVLAGLQDERARASAPDELSLRRRLRQRVRERLAVAGLVAGLVVGGGIVIRSVDPGNDSASSDSGAGAEAGGRSLPGSRPNALPLAPDQAGLPYIRPDRARSDVLRRTPDAQQDTAARAPCVTAGPGQRALAVSYGGVLAALVLDPADAGRQKATIYRCSGGRTLRVLTLPAPVP